MDTPSTPLPDRVRSAARSAGLSDDDLFAECEVEVFVVSGPGGQYRNKTESGVRLRHLPTGLRVSATERRSQLQNKRVGLERLRFKLAELSRPPVPRKKTRPSMSSKRRRVDAKRRLSDKKKERHDWD